MADNPSSQDKQLFYVAPKEPPEARKPPANTVGVIGWLRENLFSGWVNSIATIITASVLIWFVGSVFSWSIFSAEWTVVNNNLRLLMVGQYERDEMWRVLVVAISMVVLSGASIGFWTEVTRPVFVTIIISLALLVFVPLVSDYLPPPPARVMVAPDESAPPLRFVGNEGETITITTERISSENAVLDSNAFSGFIEASPGTSNSRVIWNDIKQGLRTDSIDLQPYDLTFTVSLVDAAGNVIESATATPDKPEVSFEVQLPESAWYGVITEPGEANSEGFAWIRLNGVETFTTRTSDVERRIERYGEPPAFECPGGGEDCTVPLAQRNLRFEGRRDIFGYLTVQISPFFRDLLIPMVVALAFAGAGSVVGYFFRRQQGSLKKQINIVLLALWLLSMPLSFVILRGFDTQPAQTAEVTQEADATEAGDGAAAANDNWLPYVPTTRWGGLMLTLMLTAIPIVASFPIGVLLALGRANKKLIMVSTMCTVFIEVARGVPLITILFFAKLILPFFISASSDIELAPRMMVGLTLFTAAYVAEIVRGGLQIVPRGQAEAAQALGLPPFYVTWLVTLPQAIRAVIPALMSQFVSLFKDTTLVSIVGLFELLGMVELIVNGQQQYRPYQREAYLFVAVIYFVVSLVMASISRRLESTGVGSARN